MKLASSQFDAPDPPCQPADEMCPKIFADRGLRCTKQRRALYETLRATNAHPTAEELFATLSRTHQNISLATVYNTLEAFCQAGLAIKLPGKGSCSRYDASTHNHLHVRDTATGQVVDAPDHLSQTLMDHLPQELLEQIEEQLGFKVDQVQIELVGQFTRSSAVGPRLAATGSARPAIKTGS